MEKYKLQNINQSEFSLMFAPQEKETERGCIGYLRADFDRGNSFFSTWFDEAPALKIQDFKNEFDEVINYFRESTFAPLLRSRSDMQKMCNELKPTVYDGDNEIRGFKVETPKYTYFLKCISRQGDYDLYCYCYNTELLTQYLKAQSFKDESANEHKDMDTRYIDLVATYEEMLNVPENKKSTAYFGDLSLNYIKSEEAMNIACGIKHKALELLDMTQKEFDMKPEFMYRAEIRKALTESLEKFRCISRSEDKNYLFSELSVPELHAVENILQAYADGKIDLNIPRDVNTNEIDFDADFNLIIKEASYHKIGIEETVLKWYEGLEDVGYMIDVVKTPSSSLNELSKEDAEQTVKTSERIANEPLEVVEIFGKPVLFTNERLRPMDIPDGLFRYDIRHDDEGNMVQLENYVVVNHSATVICKEIFDITQEFNGNIFTVAEGLSMTPDDYNFTGESMTVEEYKNSYDELLQDCNQDIVYTADEMGGMNMG